MLPILYSSITEGTVPSNYGVGVLSSCLSASVKEERNGQYELTMEYPADGIHAADIVPNAVLKVKPNYTDNAQLFRIYKVGKTINGKFTVNAQHISYDLSGKVITSGTASSVGAATTLLTAQAGNFTINTDKSVSAPFKVTEPSSVRSWFGGKQGSILDVYGPGEWYYDNFTASFKAARGTDRGVTIRYGKNLTELSQTLDMSNLASGIIPYYKAQDGTVTTGSEVSTGLVGVTRQLAVDFSNEVDPDSATPIATQLATLATAYIANNNFTTLKNSITLNFVQLQGLTERVDLCDTVHIYFEPLGITATAKCIETVWDVINERYTSNTFGDPKTNIADTIVKTQKEVAGIPNEIDHATNLITGNLGGYVVLHDSNGDGKPDEILIMDNPDITQAVKVWRWNQNGLGYSGTGYAGPFDKLALTNDGMIVADRIKTGVISDMAGNSTINMTNGEAKMKNFKAIEDFQLIDVNDVVRAILQFSSINGASFEIKNSGGNRIAILQEDFTAGGQLVLRDNSEASRVWLGAGSNGGIMQLYDMNAVRHTTIYNETNGGGCIQLWDKGQNESYIGIYDDQNNQDINIQTTNQGGRIDVNDGGDIFGSLRVYNNGGVLDLYDSQYLNIQCTGNAGKITCITLVQTSSRKVKENVKPMDDYRKILDLEAVSFDYINKNRGTDRRGFIAEDVAKVLPNLVTPETEEMAASLDYIGMIPYLQAVIKEQEARIKALEDKLNGTA